MIVDPELQRLIPKLQTSERAGLEAKLLAEGCRDALVAWRSPVGLVLLDGHNRKAICDKHGLPYRVHEMDFDERIDAELWMLANQAHRRNLTDDQRACLALEQQRKLAEIAKRDRARAGGKAKAAAASVVCLVAHVGHQADEGEDEDEKAIRPKKAQEDKAKEPKRKRARQEAAEAQEVSVKRVRKAKQVADVDAALFERVKDGAIALSTAVREVKRRAAAEELELASHAVTQEAKASVGAVCDLRHCSMAELFASGIRPDCIITDPPYPKEYLPVFGELARLAQAVPLVAVMVGQSYLPDVIAAMTAHLRYRWTLAYLTPGGQSAQVWTAKVNTFWKPVLVFGESSEWIGDVTRSSANDNDKKHHHWGQSESGMVDLVERLSKPGQVVCDPFVGGGTTAIAALHLGRRFVGCDIDKKAVETTWRRLHAQAS